MNLIKAIGAAAIHRLAYIGGLTVQFWSGVGALPRILPIFARRGRWLVAIKQMYAIGVQALPMVAIVSACCGLILVTTQSASELGRYGATVMLRDVSPGMLKSLVLAVIIVQVECTEGLRVTGGLEGVGRSTTSAVVRSTFLIIFANLFLTTMYYLPHRT